MAHVAELGGPVLDLPLDSGGDYRLLAAALHRQPTSALATNVFPDRHPLVKPLSEDLEAALAAPASADATFATSRGFAWVVWRPAQERPDKTREWKAARLEALQTLLGTPQEEEGVYLWRVASARADGD